MEIDFVEQLLIAAVRRELSRGNWHLRDALGFRVYWVGYE